MTEHDTVKYGNCRNSSNCCIILQIGDRFLVQNDRNRRGEWDQKVLIMSECINNSLPLFCRGKFHEKQFLFIGGWVFWRENNTETTQSMGNRFVENCAKRVRKGGQEVGQGFAKIYLEKLMKFDWIYEEFSYKKNICQNSWKY